MPKAAAIILNWGMGSGIRKEMPFVPVPQRIGRMWAEPHKKESYRKESQVFLTIIKELIIFTEVMVQPGFEH